MSDYESSFVTANGLRMHLVSAGPPDGPLAVLLHGFPEFWYGWRFQLPALASAGFRVVVPDQRGYNQTEKKAPYDLRTLTSDVIGLIAALDRRSAHLVGHDWGAAVAWAVAAWHPELVEKLVIANVPHPNAMLANVFGGNWRQWLRSWYIAFFQFPWLPEFLLRRGNFAALRQSLQSTARAGSFTDQDLERYVEAWRQPGALSGMLAWYRQAARDSFANPQRVRLPRVTRPTLMLWGERDVALGVELAEASRAWATDLRLVRYPDATHWVQHDRAEDVNREIVAFLQTPPVYENGDKSHRPGETLGLPEPEHHARRIGGLGRNRDDGGGIG